VPANDRRRGVVVDRGEDSKRITWQRPLRGGESAMPSSSDSNSLLPKRFVPFFKNGVPSGWNA
jgi:hypothetical protein